MKKQGFTLLELMVVITILGVLSAVGVPKLFGFLAKAKASEVGPAAGEYIKLQDVYVTEYDSKWGSWASIGYAMQNTENFWYTGAMENNATTVGVNNSKGMDSRGVQGDASTAPEVGWAAHNRHDLNQCYSNSTWEVSVAIKVAGAGAEYTTGFGNTDSKSTEGCKSLSVSFCTISTSGSCS